MQHKKHSGRLFSGVEVRPKLVARHSSGALDGEHELGLTDPSAGEHAVHVLLARANTPGQLGLVAADGGERPLEGASSDLEFLVGHTEADTPDRVVLSTLWGVVLGTLELVAPAWALAGNFPAMASLAKIIRERREAKGLSQADLGRAVGTTQQTIDKIETGFTQRSRFLLSIARALDLDPDALLEGRAVVLEGTAAVAKAAPAADFPHGVMSMAKDLPVYASAQAGPDGMILSYEPVEWAPRPAPLVGVRGAFAMYVVNDSMEPRYRQGNLLLIHPHKVPRRGDDVLVVMTADGNEHRAFIKELVSADANTVRLRQLNPDRAVDLERRTVASIQCVIGVYYSF